MKCFIKITLVVLASCVLVVPASGADRSAKLKRTASSVRTVKAARSTAAPAKKKATTPVAKQTSKKVTTRKPAQPRGLNSINPASLPKKPRQTTIPTRRMKQIPASKTPSTMANKVSKNTTAKRRVDPKSLIARPANPKNYGPPAKYVPGPKQNGLQTRPNFSPKKPSPAVAQPTLSKFRGKPTRMTIGRPANSSNGRSKATNVIDRTKEAAQRAVEQIKQTPTPTDPRRPSTRISEKLAETISGAGRAAEQAIDDPVGTANRAGRAGREVLEMHVDNAKQQGRQVADEIGRQADTARRQTEEIVRGVGNTAKEYHDSAVDAAKWAGREVQNGLEETGRQIGRDAKPVVDATLDATGRVGGAIGRKVDAARQAGQEAAESAQEAAAEAAAAAEQAAAEAAAAAQQAAAEAAAAAQQAAAEAAAAAQQAAAEAAAAAQQAAEQAKDDAKEAAKNSVQGTADAVNDFIDGLF